uniref:Uncharacterized protein n=1 Tax=Prorocentrum micans TaxID=2945 RepID=A0A7S2X6X1_PROMC
MATIRSVTALQFFFFFFFFSLDLQNPPGCNYVSKLKPKNLWRSFDVEAFCSQALFVSLDFGLALLFSLEHYALIAQGLRLRTSTTHLLAARLWYLLWWRRLTSGVSHVLQCLLERLLGQFLT